MTEPEQRFLAHRLSRRRLLGAGAAGGLTVLTACNSSDRADTASDTGGSRSRSLLEEFVVANETEPTDLLPWFSGYGAGLVTRQIYQTLAEPRLTLDRSGAVQVAEVPVLASAWERVEPTRWRFRLRDGVTFHNGEPWNAAAAKFSFDTLADTALTTRLGKTNTLRAVKSCEIVDEMTIDLVTHIPDTETLRLYLRIGLVGIPPRLVSEQGIEALQERPVGTGPYRFVRWTRGQEIVLEQFGGYWKPDRPNMRRVRFISRPEAAVRAQTVRAGEAHFAYNIGAEQARTLDRWVVGGGFQSCSIRLNNTIPPTNDVRVRRALNLALDRQAIVEGIFLGAATPVAFFGFQPVDLEPYPYDPETARRLIREAGAAGTELELVYGEGRIPEEDQLAEVYKAAFDAVGLRVRLRKVEPRQYNELGTRPFPEQPPLYMEVTSSGNFGDVAGALKDKYGCQGTGTFCKPEYDQAFNELAALEGPARDARLQTIAERLHREEVPRVWVAAVQQVHGLGPSVEADLPLNAYILLEDLRFV